jgi:hypothetical protein
MVWNDTEGLRLIQREYPWFVPHLRQFKSGVEKADIMRYFILYHHGGIYADLDMEAVSPLCLATPSHMMVALSWGTVSACAPAVSREHKRPFCPPDGDAVDIRTAYQALSAAAHGAPMKRPLGAHAGAPHRAVAASARPSAGGAPGVPIVDAAHFD